MLYAIIEVKDGKTVNHAENAAVLFTSRAAAKRYAKTLNKHYNTNTYKARRF